MTNGSLTAEEAKFQLATERWSQLLQDAVTELADREVRHHLEVQNLKAERDSLRDEVRMLKNKPQDPPDSGVREPAVP